MLLYIDHEPVPYSMSATEGMQFGSQSFAENQLLLLLNVHPVLRFGCNTLFSKG